jgi:hypothetical protein
MPEGTAGSALAIFVLNTLIQQRAVSLRFSPAVCETQLGMCVSRTSKKDFALFGAL